MKRRAFLFAVAAAAIAPHAAAQKPVKIGVIGSGRIGSTIGGLWVKAGHEVMFSDRDAEQVKRAIDGLGPRARSGSVAQAAAFGDAVLIAVPYAALPAIQQQVENLAPRRISNSDVGVALAHFASASPRSVFKWRLVQPSS